MAGGDRERPGETRRALGKKPIERGESAKKPGERRRDIMKHTDKGTRNDTGERRRKKD